MKLCTNCLDKKPIDDFYKMKSSTDGHSAWCKVCMKAYKAQWRKDSADTVKSQKRRWCDSNSDKVKAHRDKHYAANVENCRAKVREWHKLNPEKASALSTKRRAVKLRAIPAWADLRAIELIYEEAQFCTEFFGIEYHVDHIIPLRHPLVCGLHCEQNLQVVTAEENLAKGNRWWPDMP